MLTVAAGNGDHVPHTRIETTSEVEQLAAGLRDAARSQPWVVVSSAFGSRDPELLIADLAEAIGDIARIFLIETGDRTRELSRLVPDRLQVYGGAGRSYPPGPDALADPARAPLRFPYGDPKRATELLATDAVAHAHAAGLFETPRATVEATGQVQGFLAGGTRALVLLDGGGMATVWRELTYPPAPLDWMLSIGQPVAGRLEVESRRLMIEGTVPDAAELGRRYPHGSVTLGLVRAVDAETATIAVHPGVAVVIDRTDVSPNPLDRADALLSVGDVVPVRVIHLQSGALYVRLSDVDDEPIVPPLALIAGGPPWLREDRPLAIAPAGGADADFEARLRFAEKPTSPAVHVAARPHDTPHDGQRDVPRDGQGGGLPTEGSVAVESRRRRAAPRPRPGAFTVPIDSDASDGTRTGSSIGSAADAGAAEATAAIAPGTAVPGITAKGATALRSTQLKLAEAQAQIKRLEAQLHEVGASDSQLRVLRDRADVAELQWREALIESATLRHTVAQLREEQRDQKRILRTVRRDAARPALSSAHADRRAQWLTLDDWVRHEIYLAWVDRVPAAERSAWPLPSHYALSSGFAPSIAQLPDAGLAKALKTVVDVLTGRVRDMPGRKLHPLREGTGALERDVVRADGARCMRAAVEQNVPAARRLHYWQLDGGTIELSRVVSHDDMQP
ncbi:MAG: hypothetical protein EPN48_17300 [Microbacteriaceae bacterium]|nr:MAG: hypothetical protein EPN48_17300 [Microbacteriaceae bacterium]